MTCVQRKCGRGASLAPRKAACFPGGDATLQSEVRAEPEKLSLGEDGPGPSRTRPACCTRTRTRTRTTSFGTKGSRDESHLKAEEHQRQAHSLPGVSSREWSPEETPLRESCANYLFPPTPSRKKKKTHNRKTKQKPNLNKRKRNWIFSPLLNLNKTTIF